MLKMAKNGKNSFTCGLNVKNGDMVVKKNLILVILDSRRIFMLGLPFDDSNYLKLRIFFFENLDFSRPKFYFRDFQNSDTDGQ